MRSESMSGWIRDLFRHRYVLYFLSSREFKVKYKSAFLGFLWAILNPLLMMIVLSIVFSLLVRGFAEGYESVPFSAFLLCALVPWTFFAFSFSSGTNSIRDNSDLIKKVYFPREIVPLATIGANLANFALSVGVLMVFLAVFGVFPNLSILFLPFVILIEVVFVTGLVLLTSGLNTMFRDVAYIVEALLMAWFYFTPIFYSERFVHTNLQNLVEEGTLTSGQVTLLFRIFRANPMECVVVSFRRVLIAGEMPDLNVMLYASCVSLGMLVLGTAVFRKLEANLADYV
ncbi:ABC transporter permease [Candidatus Hydrogenedentota bacterium]